MNVVASRLGVTLATLTASIGKLVTKGFVTRTRSEADRRHELFHREMVDEALDGLTPEEEDAFARGLLKVKTFFEEHVEK